MNRKIIKLSLAILILTISMFSTQAQVGSPYSQFGVGDINPYTFGSYKAMGGIGIGLRTNRHLNISNPAALTALDSMTVVYELGLSGHVNNIDSDLGSVQKTGSEIDYLAFGFKVTKFYATSFGLVPKSNVDYTFKNSVETDPYVGTINSYFHGSGGLHNMYWSNAFQITPKLSAGIDASFVFGAINNVRTIIFEDATLLNSKIKEEKNITGFTFKAGAQYVIDLPKETSLTVGATYQHNANLNAKIDTIGGAVTSNAYDSDGTLDPTYFESFYVNELTSNTIISSESTEKLETPSTIGFGATLNKSNLFTAGADVEIQNWGSIDHSQYNTSFENSLSVRGGFEYIPDFDNINHFYKRVRYRIGGHYTNSQIQINNTQIKDIGISFGVGLPLRNSKTSFNISFEYGQRGTLDEKLLRETYGIVSLNLSLSDIWFVKRKFK